MEQVTFIPLDQVVLPKTNNSADLSRDVEVPAYAHKTVRSRRATREYDTRRTLNQQSVSNIGGSPSSHDDRAARKVLERPPIISIRKVLSTQPSVKNLTASEIIAEQQANDLNALTAAAEAAAEQALDDAGGVNNWASAAEGSGGTAGNDSSSNSSSSSSSESKEVTPTTLYEGLNLTNYEDETDVQLQLKPMRFQLTARAHVPVDRTTSSVVALAQHQLHDDAWEAVVSFHRTVLAAARPTDIDPAAVVAETIGGKGTAARRKGKQTYCHPTAGDNVPEPLWELLTGGQYLLPLLRLLLARASEISAVTGSGFIVDRAGLLASIKAVVTPLVEPRIEAEWSALAEIVRLRKIAARKSSVADYSSRLLGDGVLAPPPRDPLLSRNEGGARLLQGTLAHAEGRIRR